MANFFVFCYKLEAYFSDLKSKMDIKNAPYLYTKTVHFVLLLV